jgi:hydrogenase maturation factor
VEREEIHVSEESRLVCAAFGLDPLVTISEGTLLITCRPNSSGRVLDRLAAKGIEAFKIGRVEKGNSKLRISGDGPTRTYVPPKFDPYWEVYARGVKEGWK